MNFGWFLPEWFQHLPGVHPPATYARVSLQDIVIMKRIPDEYATYIEHPRYGRRPRITGMNPETVYGGDVFIHWHSSKKCRIPNTAILADLSQQTPATVPVTHYYDVKRHCLDCGRSFLFFAEEQKHWYEVLGFGLDSD